jgi:hypothetical protein
LFFSTALAFAIINNTRANTFLLFLKQFAYASGIPWSKIFVHFLWLFTQLANFLSTEFALIYTPIYDSREHHPLTQQGPREALDTARPGTLNLFLLHYQLC